MTPTTSPPLLEDGVGDRAHQPDVAAAVDEAEAAAGDRRSEPLGVVEELRRSTDVGSAEDPDPHRHRARVGHGGRFRTRRYRVAYDVRPRDRSVRPIVSPSGPDLSAAAEVVDLADDVIGAAVRHLNASRRTRRPAGPRLRPRPRRVGRGDRAGAARLRRQGRHRGPHHVRLRRRHGPRPDHPRWPGARSCGASSRRRCATPTRSWRAFRDPEFVAALAESSGPRHLDADMELVQDTFRSFAQNVVAPQAEHVHRTNGDVPEDVIEGLAEIGAFGLSVPAEYGGYSEGGDGEYLAMVIATEELSRASLGIGGSLITRPEILTRALVKGGTEEQKLHWLPKLATAEVMVGRRRDRARLRQRRRRSQGHGDAGRGPDGAPGTSINGVKTWCTFAARADVLMLLARTDPDRVRATAG